MKSNRSDQQNQERNFDPETGEVTEQDVAAELYGSGDGPQPDGSIVIPKMTMATIRANPERAKLKNHPVKCALVTGMGGNEFLMPPMDQQARMEALPPDNPERMTFTAIVATMEPFGAVVYDDDGRPAAVFKSDFLFLPIGHNAVLARLRQYGTVPLALEFWAQPSSNPRGYSWYFHNLAKYERGISPVDRLLKLGVEAGKQLEHNRGNVGLLADLRG